MTQKKLTTYKIYLNHFVDRCDLSFGIFGLFLSQIHQK